MKTLALLLLTTCAVHAAALPEAAKIDSLLAADWQKNGLQGNAPASDDVLVRRLYLDIAGRIPTVEERQEFISSNNHHHTDYYYYDYDTEPSQQQQESLLLQCHVTTTTMSTTTTTIKEEEEGERQ